jgi:hypothetical protein
LLPFPLLLWFWWLGCGLWLGSCTASGGGGWVGLLSLCVRLVGGSILRINVATFGEINRN